MITFDGALTIDDVVALADRRTDAELDPRVLDALQYTHTAAAELAARFPTYGRTTGVGANRELLVEPSDPQYGMRLLRSHAVDAGDPLDDRTVRAMIAVRIGQLCSAGAGLDPDIVTALVTMLNSDALPVILQYASIGTGDLAALSGTALTLMGERPATRPLPPMPAWGADSALPFMSSSALTIARISLVVDELRRLEKASRIIYLLSFIALDGNPSAFSAAAAAAAAAPEVDTLAAHLRAMIADGVPDDRTPARIQDPYGLRVYPVAHATIPTSLRSLTDQVTRSMNIAQENPLFDVDGDAVVHHGAFYQASLSLNLDAATLALALSAPITHSRIRMLNDPETNGARPFQASGPEGSSGLMMVEYVAAAAIAEIRNSAQPASVGTLVLSRGAEEDASFASQGTLQLERSTAAYRVLLSCELIGAVRLLRENRNRCGVTGVAQEAVTACDALPTDTADRDLRGDLAIADSLLHHLGAIAGRY